MIAVFALMATASFSGYVPPHLANDGRHFIATAGSEAPVREALSTCAVADYRMLAPAAGAVRYRFATAPADVFRAECVAGRLAGIGSVHGTERQSGD